MDRNGRCPRLPSPKPKRALENEGPPNSSSPPLESHRPSLPALRPCEQLDSRLELRSYKSCQDLVQLGTPRWLQSPTSIKSEGMPTNLKFASGCRPQHGIAAWALHCSCMCPGIRWNGSWQERGHDSMVSWQLQGRVHLHTGLLSMHNNEQKHWCVTHH